MLLNKRLVLRFALLIGVVLVVSCGIARASLLTENFDGGVMPTDWSAIAFSGGGNWSVAVPSLPSVAAHSGSYVALYPSYYTQDGSSARLSTPSMDLSGYTSAALSFWMYHDTGYLFVPDAIQPQITTDGGSTWTGLSSYIPRYDGTNQWTQVNLDLTSYIGNADVRLGFLSDSGYGNNMFIDDVSVTANGEAVPEPASLALVAVGLAALLLRRRT